MARPRSAALVLLLAASVTAISAKCIERTSSYVDQDGYTHVVGQFTNDIDVQATRMMLQATLYDANGGVVATKVAPTCPPDSQPHSQTVFDIRFDNPGIAPWTRFDVRPNSAVTVDAPLPDPKVIMFLGQAIRFTSPLVLPGLIVSPNDVYFTFRLRNQSNNTYSGVQGCAAVYDNSGSVVFVAMDELVHENQDGSIVPAVLGPQELTDVFWVAPNVPKGPTQVRAWFWFGKKGDPTSQYQYVSTPMITIQPVAP